MPFQLTPLPYDADALNPWISTETVQFHHGKHHRGYVNKLNAALEGTPDGDTALESLIRTLQGPAFNAAAQVWNHDFYWRSMSPAGGGEPAGDLHAALQSSFGSVDGFRQQLAEAANAQFGSGWAWLVHDGSDKLTVLSTSDADNPLRRAGTTPLLTLDVWEHAYYLDYRNERDTYVQRFIDHLIDWRFVGSNLQAVNAAVAVKG